MFKPKRCRRYHYKVFFPPNLANMIVEFVGQLTGEIGFTNHAEEERRKDKRGEIPKVTKDQLFSVESVPIEVYEILTNNGRPTGALQKIVIRIKNLSDKFDYVYVLAREGFVVSNWINDKTDEHRLTNSLLEYYVPSELKQAIHGQIYAAINKKVENV